MNSHLTAAAALGALSTLNSHVPYSLYAPRNLREFRSHKEAVKRAKTNKRNKAAAKSRQRNRK